MSLTYGPRADATRLAIRPGQTLGTLLAENEFIGQLNAVALYNWGTSNADEIKRALVELVGCSGMPGDLLTAVLDPKLGTGQPILKPQLWQPVLAVGKTHTVKVKRRLPATAVAITALTALFNPETETCTAHCRFEGAGSRADKRDFEVHATGYFANVQDREGVGPNQVEKPCGTDDVADQYDPEHTHLVRRRLPAEAEQDISWDGASEATKGVFQAPLKVTSRCAPYTVLIRYYKDEADKDVRVKLMPFYPRWSFNEAALFEVEKASLLVTWALKGNPSSIAKLKLGQLTVHNKDGVQKFCVALDQAKIAAGWYDLSSDPLAKAAIKREEMPYRIQLQIHSDSDEDNGLALATMPTQVPGFNYRNMQFIGFNVRNDVVAPPSLSYLGDADSAVDIGARCAAMIEAIQLAAVDAAPERTTLKVFVAPEFYFRGRDGAYPVEQIATILPRLRAETVKYQYLDWLFVFGTAIGRQRHETAAASITHGEAIHRVELVAMNLPTTISIKVWSVPKQGWVFQQGGIERTIVAVGVAGGPDPANGGKTLTIQLASTAGLVSLDRLVLGPAKTVEPLMRIADIGFTLRSAKTEIKVASSSCARIPIDPATKEVIAVAGESWKLVSGGIMSSVTKVRPTEGGYWLTVAPGGAYRKGAPVTLQEPVTTEVFNVALVQKGWHAPHLGDSLREIVTYKEYISHIDFIRKPGNWSDAGNRKITLEGVEDRPVLPTDGSRDLGGADANIKRRPRSAVGSEINKSGLGGGCVFTVHNITFGLEVCLDHGKHRLWDFYAGPDKRAGDPKVQVQLIPSWGMSIGGCTAGKEISTLDGGLIFNVDGSRMESVARVWDQTYSCDTHADKSGLVGTSCDKPAFILSAGVKYYICKKPPHPNYVGQVPCVTHGSELCGKKLRAMGHLIPAIGPPLDAPLTAVGEFFPKRGNVQIFEVQPLPPHDVVR